MKFFTTPIKDCYILEPQIFKDSRGYFFESFNQKVFEKETGLNPYFVQDNQSKSSYGVVRGLHGQKEPYAQAKLVRVLEGTVLDVVLDIRKTSPSFGQVYQIELSSENQKQLFIPKGCLHGFGVLSEQAVFFYKCDNNYNKTSEIGINPLDLTLDIDWRVHRKQITLSEKDKNAMNWLDFSKNL